LITGAALRTSTDMRVRVRLRAPMHDFAHRVRLCAPSAALRTECGFAHLKGQKLRQHPGRKVAKNSSKGTFATLFLCSFVLEVFRFSKNSICCRAGYQVLRLLSDRRLKFHHFLPSKFAIGFSSGPEFFDGPGFFDGLINRLSRPLP
jgi:hypothetical protein